MGTGNFSIDRDSGNVNYPSPILPNPGVYFRHLTSLIPRFHLAFRMSQWRPVTIQSGYFRKTPVYMWPEIIDWAVFDNFFRHEKPSTEAIALGLPSACCTCWSFLSEMCIFIISVLLFTVIDTKKSHPGFLSKRCLLKLSLNVFDSYFAAISHGIANFPFSLQSLYLPIKKWNHIWIYSRDFSTYQFLSYSMIWKGFWCPVVASKESVGL